MALRRNIFLRRLSGTAPTIDVKEVEHFKQLASEWWDAFGPMKPLHAMNKLRIPLVTDGLVNMGSVSNENAKSPTPLKGMHILDVGCGGGILSEPLARLGANVTGIDATGNLISLAKTHAESKNLCINYMCTTIEDFSKTSEGVFDAVVASEVVEHVTEKSQFLAGCVKCVKPHGSVFITTMNQTFLANVLGIWAAENVLSITPRGTHEIDKFIQPHKLQRLLEDNGCRTKLVHGMFYNVLANNWHWCSSTTINYALHAIKEST